MAVDAKNFDRDFYLAMYLDVAASNMDPYQHYLLSGWREGRDPNSLFDTSYYLAKYSDVAQAGVDPLEHYMLNGWREGRNPSAAFDTKYYLSTNPDVDASGMNPLLHYLQFGRLEGRAPIFDSYSELQQGFDRGYYLKANLDVAGSTLDAFTHYKVFGRLEGRSANGLFDKAFYLSHNPDVAASGMDPLQHFVTFGWREGRDPSAVFSLSDYRQAVGTPAGQNPLVNYLWLDRSSSWSTASDAPQIIQARGNPLDAIIVGQAAFAIDGALIHATASLSPLDGHDLSGFLSFNLSRSIADVAISGSGRIPLSIQLGTGDDRISGTFNLEGQFLFVAPGAGKLSIDANIDNGTVQVLASTSSGGDVLIRGNATAYFTGGAGNDAATLGAGSDSLEGGGGTNYLNGGAGDDTVSWRSAVKADLMTGKAVWLGQGAFIDDTLVSVENLGGSPFNDILLGDDKANRMDGVFFSPSPSGNDIMAGRGGDDTLWGGDGADVLGGGRGADILVGGEGDDLLIDSADGPRALGIGSEAYGWGGNDRFVALLTDSANGPSTAYYLGAAGADTYILDTTLGHGGIFRFEFSQIDGDKVDLSALRNASGATVTFQDVKNASSNTVYGSTTIDLAQFRDAQGHALQGRILLEGVFASADLHAQDFIFSQGADWRAGLSSELLGFLL